MPNYVVKVVSNESGSKTERFLPEGPGYYNRVVVHDPVVDDEGNSVGVRFIGIVLGENNLKTSEDIIELPKDGEVIYQMNEKGDTVHSYRWPRKKKGDRP